MQTEAMNKEFGISNKLSFAKYKHTTIANIQSDYSKAKISLYGAQVLSFITEDNEELLFMSSECIYKEGTALRGGIPICWPWFGPNKEDTTLPSHGFARTSNWSVVNSDYTNGETSIELELLNSPKTLELWPYFFKLTINIIVSKKLTVALKTTNLDSKPFEISTALHTYFNINDINTVSVDGLANTNYIDSVTNTKEIQETEILQFNKRTDRQYYNTDKSCIISDNDKKVQVDKEGSKTTVVWNPGFELSQQMGDLGNDDYKNMLCVEASNAYNDIISIQPQEEHTISTSIYKL